MESADHIYTITAVIIISILQWYLEFESDDLDRYLQQLCKFRVVKGLKTEQSKASNKIYRTEYAKKQKLIKF